MRGGRPQSAFGSWDNLKLDPSFITTSLSPLNDVIISHITKDAVYIS